MRIMLTAVLIAGFVLATSAAVFAGSTAAQTFNVQISAISEIGVNGNPGALTVSAATAGSNPTTVTDASTGYAVTTNVTGKKITGQITTGDALPSGIVLQVNLAAPAVGTSTGAQTLLASGAVDLVTGIGTVAQGANIVTYTLSATAAAGILSSTSKTITFTLTDGA